ncbi:hypothetical protein [Halorubrum ezzemoulense]|uniref:Uncharacterized protein n=1 Tax=Halorubrum ezzemoulense TaxID=337243 RepID=A0A481RCB4_HALEZ|nr:hypothetical protein [Halorubrum ezzemoulense]QAY18884.1 hypothetical protein EO776_02015 [Halorubrum ezzemoulense]
MIELHPNTEVDHSCPICNTDLPVEDWHIPGMRMVAELLCPECDCRFFGDLPVGHGLVYPALVHAETGEVYQEVENNWFANWLEESYADRKHEQVPINKETEHDISKPIVLNCLDGLYGHSLLKLLNAQYYLDKKPNYDLIILIPSNLKWLVPEGVAGVWSFDIPLSRAREWNDWISQEVKSFLKQFDQVWGSVAFSHPHPEDYDITRYTDIQSFPLDSWSEMTPTVTYIWRDDRLWAPSRHSSQTSKKACGTIYWAAEKLGINLRKGKQRRNVVRLAKNLKSAFPRIEFTVAGLGQPGGLPDFITDARTTSFDNNTEQKLCDKYSESHVVIGIHGSNMLLPSAHAGSVVELVPPKRWGNMTQDLLFGHGTGNRESIYSYRHVPRSTAPKEVAIIVRSLLEKRPQNTLHMAQKWTCHESIDYKEHRSRWKQVD